MDKTRFNKKLQAWLELQPEERNLEDGALMLLQLTNNRAMYRHLQRNLAKNAEMIEYQLKKYLNFRIQEITHEEVETMATKVEAIAKEHRLEEASPLISTKQPTEWKAGKRADHDSLPTEIQALYTENATIMHQMRELHLKLRNLSGRERTCPDSDRYPFLKEIIALDKRYHENWKTYDNYTGEGSEKAAEEIADDYRLQQKVIQRQINLAKGQYKKKPTEEKKAKVQTLYKELGNPTEKLTNELQALGII